MILLAPAPVVVRVGDLDLAPMSQEWGKPGRNLSVDGKPMKVAGESFAHGVGTHATSRLDVRLNGRALRFTARVGVDDEVESPGSVRFLVYADGTLRADSGVIRSGQSAKAISVDLTGVKVLRLETDDANDGINYDHGDWGLATIETNDPESVRTFAPDFGPQPDPELAPVDRRTTRINGPALLGGTPGRPFLYRVPTSGARPIRYSVERLPAGLTFDAAKGRITGTLPPQGDYKFSVRASGPGGTATKTITLVSGERPLPTPLLGWNSWYAHFLEVDEAGVRRAARAMDSTGLADFGFRYVNIDDGWEAEERAPDGEIRTNAKFPDMKGLVDEIHGLGLRAGLYSSPGPRTCGQYLGSYQHEGQDAHTWAKWGFDLIKYDWCSYGGVAKDGSLAELRKPYELMQTQLADVDRDIALSLCQYGMGDVRKWGREVGGSLWRTTGDITDIWRSVASIGFENGGADAARGDDPDMLMVGVLLSTGKPMPSRLTKNEQVSQVSLWSLRGAPLLLSCDLTRLDEFTRRLLMNPEVLDVDQALSAPGRKVADDGTVEVWRRDLDDGTYAVAVFNRGPESRQVPMQPIAWLPPSLVAYKEIKVRDLWRRRDVPRLPKSVLVAGHGAKLYRISAR